MNSHSQTDAHARTHARLLKAVIKSCEERAQAASDRARKMRMRMMMITTTRGETGFDVVLESVSRPSTGSVIS